MASKVPDTSESPPATQPTQTSMLTNDGESTNEQSPDINGGVSPNDMDETVKCK